MMVCVLELLFGAYFLEDGTYLSTGLEVLDGHIPDVNIPGVVCDGQYDANSQANCGNHG